MVANKPKRRKPDETLETTAPIAKNSTRPWLNLGRKSSYNLAKARRFCSYISLGYSLKKACNQEDMPSIAQVYEWKRKYPEFSAMYEEAQVERGLTLGDRIGELAEQVLSGEVDPQAARVAMDGYKFTAARLASKTWGEKSQVTVEHGISQQAAQVLQDLSQRARQRQELQAPVIDVTPQSVGPSVGLVDSSTDYGEQ